MTGREIGFLIADEGSYDCDVSVLLSMENTAFIYLLM
jgi:hypothetical protein